MRKLLASLVLAALITSPAYAWGPREQGALAGVAGLYLLQHAGVVNAPQPHVYAPSYPAYSHVPPARSYTYQPMYKMVDVFIPECNCYRSVMVQIN